MHNGAYSSLEAVVIHHLKPTQSLYGYDPAIHLPPELRDTFQQDRDVLAQIILTLDMDVVPNRIFSDEEVSQLVAFLEALTDPAVQDLNVIPDAVPSGLPVRDAVQAVAGQ